ncbi:hypothetical protein Glo7428_3857 [Gloeocapsa sp. PCC 7428]|nr:hypothetical protein Glo7428_3857 [Gloeocapsa sp. PCC 7428]
MLKSDRITTSFSNTNLTQNATEIIILTGRTYPIHNDTLEEYKEV